MVSIIKNQLLKHLSRFTKNLSADKINLSTFKGEGELSNLELDEIVLTDLLELPSWLKLKRAWCNRVLFRIPWTKLKTVPIYLNLDEVNIIVETCEELRSCASPTSSSAYSTVPGKYSFIHKVIDGITINVNTVYIIFNSPAFTASVQISRIIVESKSPQWARSDLRVTRLKNNEKGQILIFKELEWQTVRIEAKSTVDKQLTPLRLLTNHARCRITLKKRLSDCFIMGSRLVLILDDLLWVLTDSQLKAALHFLDSLAGLVQKATELTRKEKAARKLEVLPEYQAQVAQEARANVSTESSVMSNLFKKLDVIETSYHFLSQHIVLHLCDDPGDGRSCHPNLKDGGALQISLHGFQVDYYPYHLAVGDRKHWPKYKDGTVPHTQWLEQSQSHFRSKLIDLIDKNRSQHTPLSRSSQQNQDAANKSKDNSPQGPGSEFSKKTPNPFKKEVLKQLAKLMTTCIILRIEDFCLYKVTTSGKKQALKEFISGDRDHISLPEDTNILHAEFTYYYYPGDIAFPLPPPKFYVQLNPTQIYFDIDSCLWFNSFALNLHQSLAAAKPDINSANLMYVDVKIEAILPRIILENNTDHHTQRDRPKSLHLQVTRATITNVRSLEHSSRADLAKCVDSFYMGSLFFGSEFPSQPDDFYIVTQKFLDHISATDNIRTVPDMSTSILTLTEHFSRELLWTEAKDVWCISLDPVWVDFLGARSVGGNRPIPFLDAVPVTIWAHMNFDSKPKVLVPGEPKTADLHALAYISNLVSVQLNHYQYLFLLRMMEDLAELATFLAVDSNRILKQDSNKSIAIGALIPQLELTFVMPSQCPGKESSGGDLESVIPDSSSIADDILAATGSGTTLWQTDAPDKSWVRQDVAKIPVIESPKSPLQAHLAFQVSEPNMPAMMTLDLDSVSASKVANGVGDLKNTPQQQSSQAISNMNANFNTGLNSVKKGFNNFLSSIDSALKSNPDDASDTVSIRSDASSDSENYVVVSREMEPGCIESMFRVQGVNYDTPARANVVEMASEVIEEDNTATTPSEHSLASTYKRRDLVSVVTFKLSKVEFLQQSAGFASNLKVQVSNVISEECGSIPWDEFQSKFSSRSRAWMDIPANSNTTTRMKLRLDHDLALPIASLSQADISNRNSMRKLFKDTINIQVRDLDLDLSMSAVTGLTDLIEDEILPENLPMQIIVDNVKLHIIEDRPPNNITSPGPVPINLNINQLFINKDADGIFNIMPLQKSSISSSISSLSISVKEEKDREQETQLLHQTIKQIKTDNEELKRRLVAFDRISEENRTLRKTKEESEILRAYLSSAQDDIAKLIEDKKTLLDNLQKMEEHLRQTDRGRQWITKR